MPVNDIDVRCWQRLRLAGMWLFLGPLIILLGIVDIVTNGRSRNWPLGEKPREDGEGYRD
jgi:hypothetical protein